MFYLAKILFSNCFLLVVLYAILKQLDGLVIATKSDEHAYMSKKKLTEIENHVSFKHVDNTCLLI